MENPEKLHEIGQSKKSVATSKFVNPGTPSAPLVRESDLRNAEISKEGSKRLRDGLTK